MRMDEIPGLEGFVNPLSSGTDMVKPDAMAFSGPVSITAAAGSPAAQAFIGLINEQMAAAYQTGPQKDGAARA